MGRPDNKKIAMIAGAAAVLIAGVLAASHLPQTPASGQTQTRPVLTAPGETRPAEPVPGQTAPAVQTTVPAASEPDLPTTPPVDTQPEQWEDPDVPRQTDPSETEPAGTGIGFPLMLEDGRIRIEEPFVYDGLNPDCGWEEGKSIAAISLKNLSAVLLEEAEVELTLSDGSVVLFRAEQIPAEGTVLAFAAENIGIADDAVWISADFRSVFSDLARGIPEGFSVEVDGLEVTVTNRSGKAASEIVVYCHNTLGEEYFGGIAYAYKIKDLPAGASTTILAADCILGLADVTRIDVK